MGPFAAMMVAMGEAVKARVPRTDAKVESDTRKVTAWLDEKLASQWTPGAGQQMADRGSARIIEVGARAGVIGDSWEQIDKRLAEAYYETQTFADYIGAPWQYPKEDKDED